MKRIYKITQVALFGAFIVGCTDLDTAPLSSTITADQKEDVVAADPSKIEASVTAITANFTQYAKIYTEDDNVHSDIGYPTIMLATDSRTTDFVADITGYPKIRLLKYEYGYHRILGYALQPNLYSQRCYWYCR